MPFFSDINMIRVCNSFLGIHDDVVAFQQNQITLGDHHGTVSLDHDNKGLPGNIQFLDAHTVPGIVLEQNNFFQVNVAADLHPVLFLLIHNKLPFD